MARAVMMKMRDPSQIIERWTPQPSGANPAHYIPAHVPTVDTTAQLCISLINISILAVLLTRRVVAVKHWTKLQPLNWLVLFIYTDSTLFVVLSAVVSLGIGSNISEGVCLFADFLCLASYFSTKGIYYFLVEKVYLIRSIRKPRLEDPLYIFHAFGLIVFYVILTILQFVYRIGYISTEGQCYNGIQAHVLIPLLLFDTGCNIYLMIMFIIPLRQLMSYSNPNSLSRQIAIRTLIGTSITLLSSIVNMVQLIVVQGERSWLCLITCNLDILLSVLVVQWITAKDGADSGSSQNKDTSTDNDTARNDRALLRPEKPIMMPLKAKRKDTDFSDEFEDIEGGIELDNVRQNVGKGGTDGQRDSLGSERVDTLNLDAITIQRFNTGPMALKPAAQATSSRSSNMRENHSSDSLSLPELRREDSADSTTRFMDTKEGR